MLAIFQTLPTIDGAPWWVIVILFAIVPAAWKATTYLLDRNDKRREERNALLAAREAKINELNDRLLSEALESRDVAATMSHTLETFLKRDEELTAWRKEVFARQQSMEALIIEINDRTKGNG